MMLVMPHVLPVTTSRLPEWTETLAIDGLPTTILPAGVGRQQLRPIVLDD
jgi:hypothetical protein